MKETKKNIQPNVNIPKSAQSGLIALIVFLGFMGQMMLNPIIAPLSRDLGLQEWHIGMTISIAAVVLAILSPYWGRTSQRFGAKRTLIAGTFIAGISLASFAIVSFLGMNHIVTSTGVALGVLTTRGLLYGAGISAVAPTAQAYLVSHTKSEADRVKALGMIGAAQGLASVVGGIVGGVLAAFGGLMLPLIVMPIIMLTCVAVIFIKFQPQAKGDLIEQPKQISFDDPRVRPWLVAGLVMFLAFSSIATIFGFAIQDRFEMPSDTTAGVAAIYLTVMGVMMIVGQAVITPKTGWNATKLFRTGLVILLIGVGCLWPSNSHILLTIACILVGLGMGLAVPGYNTGPTLNMADDEQGNVAGLINANNGIAYAVAPIMSTALYGWNPLAPFIASIALIATNLLYIHIHPLLRK